MMRLQSRMGGRMGILYTKELLYSMSIFIGKNGANAIFEALEKVQMGYVLQYHRLVSDESSSLD